MLGFYQEEVCPELEGMGIHTTGSKVFGDFVNPRDSVITSEVQEAIISAGGYIPKGLVSDLDYFAQDSIDLWKHLSNLGFKSSETYYKDKCLNRVMSLTQYLDGVLYKIDIQLVKDVELKRKAQQLIQLSLAENEMKMSEIYEGQRPDLWNAACTYLAFFLPKKNVWFYGIW